jgi:hypothetical protein
MKQTKIVYWMSTGFISLFQWAGDGPEGEYVVPCHHTGNPDRFPYKPAKVDGVDSFPTLTA